MIDIQENLIKFLKNKRYEVKINLPRQIHICSEMRANEKNISRSGSLYRPFWSKPPLSEMFFTIKHYDETLGLAVVCLTINSDGSIMTGGEKSGFSIKAIKHSIDLIPIE